MSKPESARPLSGEIIDNQRPPAGHRPAASGPCLRDPEVIDAEFEAVEAPRHRPTAVPPKPAERHAADPAGMGMLKRAAAQPRTRELKRGGPLFYLTGCAIALAAFWISGGHALMSQAGLKPVSASDGSLRIASVDTRVESGNGRPLLLVDGEIFNPGFRHVEVPDVAIEVLDHGGRTTRYYLGTNSRRIDAGGRFGFSSRVHVPKEGVKSVSVTFRQ